MIYVFILIVLFLAPTCVYRQPALESNVPPGSLAYLDAHNGFRDVRFGQSPQEIGGLVEVEREGELVTYERPSDDRTFGDILLTGIGYTFWRNSLMAIHLSSWGVAAEVLATLQEAYGPGTQRKSMPKEIVWLGTVATARYYVRNEGQQLVTVQLSNHRLLEAYRRAAAKTPATKSGL